MQSLSPDAPIDLAARQDEILKVLSGVLPLDAVITGGTALTRFYGFDHRLSDDIDIFFYADRDKTHTHERVLKWLSALSASGLCTEILFTEGGSGGLVYHASALVTSPARKPHPIRLDFVEDIFSGCWLPNTLRTSDSGIPFQVDSIEAILHKKLYAAYCNCKANKPPRGKDIVDIYSLFKNRFDFRAVLEFYRDAREITLPFESVMEHISGINVAALDDFHLMRGLKAGLESEIISWQEEVSSALDNPDALSPL